MRRILGPWVLLLLPFLAACGGSGANDGPDDAPSATAPAFVRDDGRTNSLYWDLSGFVGAVDDALAATGRVPASRTDGALADHFFSLRNPKVDYRPSTDGKSFTLCLQAGRSGPWVSYDSARRRIASTGLKGACSFDAPESGSALEVRRDQWQIQLSGSDRHRCKDFPTTAQLRRQGQLSPGNRIGGCRVDEYQDGDVEVLVYCVQHGDDGPWATYDGVDAVARGDGGACRLDIGQDADQG